MSLLFLLLIAAAAPAASQLVIRRLPSPDFLSWPSATGSGFALQDFDEVRVQPAHFQILDETKDGREDELATAEEVSMPPPADLFLQGAAQSFMGNLLRRGRLGGASASYSQVASFSNVGGQAHVKRTECRNGFCITAETSSLPAVQAGAAKATAPRPPASPAEPESSMVRRGLVTSAAKASKAAKAAEASMRPQQPRYAGASQDLGLTANDLEGVLSDFAVNALGEDNAPEVKPDRQSYKLPSAPTEAAAPASSKQELGSSKGLEVAEV